MAEGEWSRVGDAELVAALRHSQDRLNAEYGELLAILREALQRNVAGALGYRGLAALLRDVQRIGPAEANRRVAQAEAVTAGLGVSGVLLPAQLPRTAAAVASGAIGAEQVEVIRRVIADLPPEVDPADIELAEKTLVEAAHTIDPAGLAKLGRAVTARLDQDGRPPTEAELRHPVNELRWTPRRDGGLAFTGRLAAEGAALLTAVLSPLAKPRPAADGTADSRTRAERHGDAFVDALRLAANSDELPTEGGERPTLLVTMTLDALREQTAPALLGGSTLIDARQARRLACDAAVIPAVLGARSEPLDLGRKSRIVSTAIRRALILRDGGCAFPGCTMPPRQTDAHHRYHWANGGNTDLDNLVLLCGIHHDLIHHSEWEVQHREGIPEFIPPPYVDPLRRPRRNPIHHPKLRIPQPAEPPRRGVRSIDSGSGGSGPSRRRSGSTSRRPCGRRTRGCSGAAGTGLSAFRAELVRVLMPTGGCPLRSRRGTVDVSGVREGKLVADQCPALPRWRQVGQGWNGGGRMAAKRITHPTLEDRIAAGVEARARTSLSSHTNWRPAANRPDPVTLLEEQNVTREPDLVPVRHGRMMVSPFTFYRGAAKVMAADLNDTPVAGLNAQLCGDAHLSNFGAFASPERKLLFDLNDFDETLPGPFEYDVKRMAASFTIAARNNGFAKADARASTLAVARAYREAMATFAAMRTMDVWYAHLDEDRLMEGVRSTAASETKSGKTKSGKTKSGKGGAKKQEELVRTAVKLAERTRQKARTRDSLQALSKLGELVDGRYRIVSQPPIVVPARDLVATHGVSPEQIELMVREQFRAYRSTMRDDLRHLLERFQVVDMARKVVGVGSVGTRAFIVLLQGRDAQDPLFLQIKEATTSVLESFLPKSRYRLHGERVVQGQRMMQAASDIYLGWTKGHEGGRHFYWRQLRDMKASAAVELMTPVKLGLYARICGWTLARAHARSGDPVAIDAYLGGSEAFDRSITDFSERYADQNERDFEQFVKAVRSGRLEAVEGV